jgi:hypothetical protein
VKEDMSCEKIDNKEKTIKIRKIEFFDALTIFENFLIQGKHGGETVE